MKYIIGNWKANKTVDEATSWSDQFSQIYTEDPIITTLASKEMATVIICPSYPHIPLLVDLETLDQVEIGAQTVSSYAPGSHTGDVTATHLKGLVSYVIIGHSERRASHNEDNHEVAAQIQQAQEAGIAPILCVRGPEDTIPESVPIVAFEPVSAIGTGSNMPVDEVLSVKQTLSLPENAAFLYGGSVKPDTAAAYLSSPEIDGLLIGGASLDPESFIEIIRATAQV